MRLPLFGDLPGNTILRLSASGYGRGFLTASLRARLRKAGFRDLGHLAQSSPDAIAKVRKFGAIRVAAVRTYILEEIARWMPCAREMHAPEATKDRRLARLRYVPVERLPLNKDKIATLGFDGGTCADLAGRSRLELLRAGVVASSDLDRIVATLASLLEGGGPIVRPAMGEAIEALVADAEEVAARRSTLLAEQDREWEEAAPRPNL
jgi:hypothetical protein